MSETRYAFSELLNGLAILTYTDPNLEVADFRLMVRCGYRFEKPEELGFAHFLEHMLLKGTKRHPTPEALAAVVEDLGGYRNAATSLDHVSYILQVDAGYTMDMIQFLADIMFESLLDPERTEQEKGPILQELRRAIGDHDRFIARRSREVFFSGHPLERTILKTEQSTNATTAERLRDHMSRLYGADRAALVISSPWSHQQVQELVSGLFGQWGRTTEQVIEEVPFTYPEAARVHEVRDTPQTFVSLSYPGPHTRDTRMLAAGSLISTFLSSGGSSLLMSELRNKRSLVYWADAGGEDYPDAGRFEFSTATEKPEEAIAVASSILENLCDHLRPEHLDAIKRRSLGVSKRHFANGGYRAGFMESNFIAYRQLITPEQAFSELQAVAYEDIEEFVRRYLRPEKAVLFTLGPKELSW